MDLKDRAIVEAALFSASEAISVQDLVEKTGLDVADIRYALLDLRREYDERESAIMIAKIGNDYRMMLRTDYSQFTGKFARAEMSGGMMRTLSTIAYNQPVKQSKLMLARGGRTYDDVKALIEMGFIHGKKVGQTLELTTTNKFAEHFGIGSNRIPDIKAWIEAHWTKPQPQSQEEGGEGQ